jgi:hypothetical protein
MIDVVTRNATLDQRNTLQRYIDELTEMITEKKRKEEEANNNGS